MDHSAPPPELAVGQGHEVAPAARPAAARWPVGRWLVPLGWYAAAAAATVAILAVGLRLDKADFHAPFTYEYDALLILPFVKATVERGSHWRNERLGAPGVQELHDFPVVDHLHFALIWALGQVVRDPVVVFNLFHLLTYPLTTLAGMFVLRRLGLSIPAAGCGGILYAFQPYHYLRGQMHYFLAAYYVVPLTLLVTLRICQGRLPFFEPDPDGRYRRRLWSADALAAVLIGVATASAGAYYAFFACALLVCAGVYGWVVLKTWRAFASAWLVIAVIVLAGVVNHAPTFAYQYRFGQNSRPHARMAEDAERYGLKIAQLVLPVPGHNPVGFGDDVLFDPAAVRSKYQAPSFKEVNESEWDPLGLVGAVGYLALLAAAVFPVRRRWPVGPLAALTLFATLLGTIGGGGAIFNLLVSSQVRCYNRVSIYIAFLGLFFACWLLDRFFDTRRGWARRLRWPAFAAVVAFGVWDQTNEQWFPDVRTRKPGCCAADESREQAAARYREDREFFGKVEELLGDGMVFTYPYVEYPEGQPYQELGSPGRTESYDMVLGYLHTTRLRWSFGAMKGREWDTWAREVCGERNPHRFINRLVWAGFEGLLIDSRGINPARFKRFKEDIEGVLGHGATREYYPARGLYFISLREYRDYLRRSAPTEFETNAREEQERLTVLWLKGFTCYEPVGYEWHSHWCGASGELVFVNRSDHTVTADLRTQFRTTFKGPARLTISGGELWSDELDVGPDERPPEYARRLVIPPGRHTVRLRCRPGVSVLPTDSRDELFTVNNFKLTEVPPQPAAAR